MLFFKSEFGAGQTECSNYFILGIENGYGDGHDIGRDFTVRASIAFADDLAQLLCQLATLGDRIFAVTQQFRIE